jgi:hypothetical protein
MNPALPASSVIVNGVTTPKRRTLLAGSGAVIDYSVQAPNTDPAALQAALASPAAQTAVNTQMNAVGFKGMAVSAPAVVDQTPTAAPTAAPTSIRLGAAGPVTTAAWATPGAIAGVAIGGAVVITLIVLLSILIPRMQHARTQATFHQQVLQPVFPSQTSIGGGGSGGGVSRGLDLQPLGGQTILQSRTVHM